MLTVSVVLACAMSAAACGESSGDIIDDFVAESGLEFSDCGSGTSCDAAGSCLASAFISCEPSRAELADGTHFVVPNTDTGGCAVIWFTTSSDAGAETFEKYECLSLGNIASGCADKDSCDIRNRWHL